MEKSSIYFKLGIDFIDISNNNTHMWKNQQRRETMKIKVVMDSGGLMNKQEANQLGIDYLPL